MRMVREAISQSIRRAGKNYSVSVSIGCFRKTPETEGAASIQSEAETWLGKADKAMYIEKNGD